MQIRATVMRDHIRNRGPTPRNLRKAMTAAKRVAWRETGEYFHDQFRDNRFTPEHAKEAQYYKRKGENLPFGSKGWARSYTGRKFAKFGHTNPLEFSGETRKAVASANITATTKGVKVAYAGARKLNFQHPKSRIKPNEEFMRVTRDEVEQLARVFDNSLDRALLQSEN